MSERWRPIPGYEGLYDVSTSGRVRTYRRKGTDSRILSIKPSRPCGYMRTSLYVDGQRHAAKIHRLVLAAFVGPCPKGKVVRHLNGNRSDNRLSNLRWGTWSENYADSVRHCTATRGSKNGQAKLTATEVLKIRVDQRTQNVIASEYGVAYQTIAAIQKRTSWAWL